MSKAFPRPQTADAAAFLIDGDQKRPRGGFAQRARQLFQLLRRNDVHGAAVVPSVEEADTADASGADARKERIVLRQFRTFKAAHDHRPEHGVGDPFSRRGAGGSVQQERCHNAQSGVFFQVHEESLLPYLSVLSVYPL